MPYRRRCSVVMETEAQDSWNLTPQPVCEGADLNVDLINLSDSLSTWLSQTNFTVPQVDSRAQLPLRKEQCLALRQEPEKSFPNSKAALRKRMGPPRVSGVHLKRLSLPALSGSPRCSESALGLFLIFLLHIFSHSAFSKLLLSLNPQLTPGPCLSFLPNPTSQFSSQPLTCSWVNWTGWPRLTPSG